MGVSVGGFRRRSDGGTGSGRSSGVSPLAAFGASGLGFPSSLLGDLSLAGSDLAVSDLAARLAASALAVSLGRSLGIAGRLGVAGRLGASAGLLPSSLAVSSFGSLLGSPGAPAAAVGFGASSPPGLPRLLSFCLAGRICGRPGRARWLPAAGQVWRPLPAAIQRDVACGQSGRADRTRLRLRLPSLPGLGWRPT